MGFLSDSQQKREAAAGSSKDLYRIQVACSVSQSSSHGSRPRSHSVGSTEGRRSEGRGKDFVLETTPAPYPQKICPGCGATTRGGRLCPSCGREVSKEKLIGLAKVGRVAAQTLESRKKHSETQRRHETAKRAWRSAPRPAWPDEKAYTHEIQPRLSSVAITTLSSTLGVCESYAADIRAGRRRPHPRHWRVLGNLVGAVKRE